MKENEHLQFFAIAPKELDNPLEIISELCEYTSLFTTRERVFELFMLSMASEDWATDGPLGKATRMWDLKLMIRMVEVVYLLNHFQETDQLRKIINNSK